MYKQNSPWPDCSSSLTSDYFLPLSSNYLWSTRMDIFRSSTGLFYFRNLALKKLSVQYHIEERIEFCNEGLPDQCTHLESSSNEHGERIHYSHP